MDPKNPIKTPVIFRERYKSASMLRQTNAGTMVIIHAGFALIYVVAFFLFWTRQRYIWRISMSDISLNFGIANRVKCAFHYYHAITSQWTLTNCNTTPRSQIIRFSELLQLTLLRYIISLHCHFLFVSFWFINDCRRCYYNCSCMQLKICA